MIEEYTEMMTRGLASEGYEEVPYRDGTIYVKDRGLALDINDIYGVMADVEPGDLMTLVVDGKKRRGEIVTFTEGVLTLDCNGFFSRFITTSPGDPSMSGWRIGSTAHPSLEYRGRSTTTDNFTWETTTGNTVTALDPATGAADNSAGWEVRPGVSGPGLTANDIMTGTISADRIAAHSITADHLASANHNHVTVSADGITLTSYPTASVDHMYLTNRVTADTDGDLVSVNLNNEVVDDTVRSISERVNALIRATLEEPSR